MLYSTIFLCASYSFKHLLVFSFFSLIPFYIKTVSDSKEQWPYLSLSLCLSLKTYILLDVNFHSRVPVTNYETYSYLWPKTSEIAGVFLSLSLSLSLSLTHSLTHTHTHTYTHASFFLLLALSTHLPHFTLDRFWT